MRERFNSDKENKKQHEGIRIMHKVGSRYVNKSLKIDDFLAIPIKKYIVDMNHPDNISDYLFKYLLNQGSDPNDHYYSFRFKKKEISYTEVVRVTKIETFKSKLSSIKRSSKIYPKHKRGNINHYNNQEEVIKEINGILIEYVILMSEDNSRVGIVEEKEFSRGSQVFSQIKKL